MILVDIMDLHSKLVDNLAEGLENLNYNTQKNNF